MILLYPNVDVLENEKHETNTKQKEQNTGPHFFAVQLGSSCNKRNTTQQHNNNNQIEQTTRKKSYVTFIKNAHKFLSENRHSKFTPQKQNGKQKKKTKTFSPEWQHQSLPRIIG